MGDKMDMALDDIIKTTKGSRGSGRTRGGGGGARGSGQSSGGSARLSRQGGRGGNRGAGGGSGGSGGGGRFPSAGRSGMSSGRWSHDMYQGGSGGDSRMPPPLMGLNTGPVKLTISNLDYGVSDSDIRELFREFGEMRTAAVHYDRSGCSLGSAQVVFGRNTDAVKAMKQYNGVHLDGRPMKIHVDGGDAQTGGRSGGSRGGSSLGGGRPMVKRLQSSTRPAPSSRGRGTWRTGRGGRGVHQGGAKSSSSDAKPKSAEELDAELDSYLSEASKK